MAKDHSSCEQAAKYINNILSAYGEVPDVYCTSGRFLSILEEECSSTPTALNKAIDILSTERSCDLIPFTTTSFTTTQLETGSLSDVELVSSLVNETVGQTSVTCSGQNDKLPQLLESSSTTSCDALANLLMMIIRVCTMGPHETEVETNITCSKRVAFDGEHTYLSVYPPVQCSKTATSLVSIYVFLVELTKIIE